MSADLLDNFALLAASEGGVAKLRELILSLAVRGKLVQQDPTDEPASALLKRIAAAQGLIILTDSDDAGFRIRHFVTGLVGAEHVLQAYVPAVHGKEARKQAPGKEGLLGVEGIADDLILQGLQTALDSAPAPQTTAQDTDRTAITYTDLYEWGISGTANSADRRRALLARLGLPPRLSKKELLQVLNTLYTWESLDAQIKMME